MKIVGERGSRCQPRTKIVPHLIPYDLPVERALELTRRYQSELHRPSRSEIPYPAIEAALHELGARLAELRGGKR